MYVCVCVCVLGAIPQPERTELCVFHGMKTGPPLLFFILWKCLANTRHPPNPWGMCFAAPWEAEPPMHFCKTKDVGAITDHDTSSTCR